MRKTRASLDRQTRQSGSPPVLDVTGLGGVEVRVEQRLVLTDSHLSATDADTVLAGGAVDPAKITFRISDITGGKLQSLSSSGAWEDMGLATGETYYAFTLADLQAGNVAFLAGDGLQAGEGEQIAFKVQVVDDGRKPQRLRRCHTRRSGCGRVGCEWIAQKWQITAGVDVRINRGWCPLAGRGNTDCLEAGSATTHNGTLHMIVKLFDMQKWRRSFSGNGV